MTTDDQPSDPPVSDEILAVWILAPTFPLGAIVATPGALEALEQANRSPMEFLARHAQRDWGDLDREDTQSNNEAVEGGGRLLSAYTVTSDCRVWIITEWDRSVTTILLPSEY